ncbi:hypothetical protein [Rosettibacter firmus]|uniref:hypothetical protein n=1 Tax=Rosettibacter firmus TaxID=3111522 RepID=UPI00336BD8BA
MAKHKKSTKDLRKQKISPFNDYWGKYNSILLIAGLVLLSIGYFLMAQGPWYSYLSLSISPIILLFAYLVVIPLSIIIKKRNTKNSNDISTS